MMKNGIGAANNKRPPRVVLAQRVLRKMAAGAMHYMDEETAEALVGLVIPNADGGEPDLYILDTIAPAHEDIQRADYMVEQGDDLQDAIMYWLAINWRRFQGAHPTPAQNAPPVDTSVPLRYLGDWHKQPGEMFWPSPGDLATAQAIIMEDDNDMPQIIAPIITLAPPWDPATGPPGDDFDVYAVQQDGPNIRVNFWYLSRAMRQFVAAKPEVLPDNRLPALPPLGWHLTDRTRFQDEYDALSGDGLAVSIVEWDADDNPPMEVCFMVGRVGGNKVLILITDHAYPAVPPAVRTAPMLRVAEDEDLFERLWAESEPFDLTTLPDWAWDAETHILLDLVRAVEAALAT